MENFIAEILGIVEENNKLLKKLAVPSFQGGFCLAPTKSKKQQIYISKESGYFWYRLDEDNSHIPIHATAVKGVFSNIYIREMWPENLKKYKPTLKTRIDLNIGDGITEHFIVGKDTAFSKTLVRALLGATPAQRAYPITMEVKVGKEDNVLLPNLYDMAGDLIILHPKGDINEQIVILSDLIRDEQDEMASATDSLEELKQESSELLKELGCTKDEAVKRLMLVYGKSTRNELTALEFDSYVAGLRTEVKALWHSNKGVTV